MTFLTNKMREEIRAISNAEKSAIEDVSDSNSSTCLSAGSKRKRRSSTCSSKYKGVVSQQNGHWGCQIYANQRRIWLGTFKSEEEAAKAYESAALKLRGGETQRNFHLTAGTNEERDFQSRHSVDAVLNMIKDGSYQSKFADYLKTHSPSVETELSLRPKDAQSDKGLTSKQLFQKELTPSDVGKLNRLVIPKKYATKFFPHAPLDTVENVAAKNAEDVQLSFYDRSMKLWKFRYCYWSSSQSYVFTRGWNRFVKEKQLKANDTVAFSLFASEGDGKANQFFYVIDVNYSENNSIGSSGVTNIESNAERGELQLRFGEKSDKEREFIMGSEQTSNAAERRAFKLFGVQIN